MGGVALGTGWNHAMGGTVAVTAIQRCMFAFILLELGHLVGMTGKTRLGNIFVNGNDERGVGVIMT